MVSTDAVDMQSVTSCQTFTTLRERGVISDGTAAFASAMGFEKLSPVQEAVIPLLISNRQDVAVEACTGSGKTLAFLIPCVELLLHHKKMGSNKSKIGGLCLAPTRELVIQINSVLELLLTHVNKTTDIIGNVLLTGGTKAVSILKSAHMPSSNTPWLILTATPGRLSTLIEDPGQDLFFKHLEILIFDEADRLFVDHASFEIQLNTILSVLPKQRRTAVFSATLSSEMKSLIKAGMRSPIFIRVKVDSPRIDKSSVHTSSLLLYSTPGGLANYYAIIRRQDKLAFVLKFLMSQILRRKRRTKCIIFFLTCASVGFYHKVLSKLQASTPFLASVQVERLSGQMNQKSRSMACKRFCNVPKTSGGILLATDVAARGLDFSDVSWIIQFDPPTDPSMVIHRIGRTARAGKMGQSLILLTPPEEACIPFFRNRHTFSGDQLLHDSGSATSAILLCLFFCVVYGSFYGIVPGGVLLSDITEQANMLQEIREVDLEVILTAPKIAKPEEWAEALQEIPVYKDKTVSLGEGELICDLERDRNWVWKFLRIALLSDRDVMMKASSTFVSFIRAYKEHHLQYIFPMSELEIGEFATSLAVLRLPRVKEILGKKIENFQQSSYSPDKIRFSDAARENEWEANKLRKQAAAEEKEVSRTPVKKPKEKKLLRQNEENSTRLNVFGLTSTKIVVRTRSEKRRTKRRREANEWDDLALEERLTKKLRQGKITLAEYERQLNKVESENIREVDTDSSGSDDTVPEEKATENIKWLKSGRRGKKKH